MEAGNTFLQKVNNSTEIKIFDDLVTINTAAESGFELDTDVVILGPNVYKYTARTTSDVIISDASGMEVESVKFETNCLSTGCWVIDVIYTTGGNDNFNAFYLPKTANSPSDIVNPSNGPYYDDEHTKDHDYESLAANLEFPWSEWQRAPGDTFLPSTFPCSSTNYKNDAATKMYVSACCLEEFIEMYRPVGKLVEQLSGPSGAGAGNIMDLRTECASAGTELVKFNPAGKDQGDEFFDMPSAATEYGMFGVFEGMSDSKVESLGVMDSQLYQYRARFRLDEVELRRFAGKLKGTVGVEHTVDTFVGFVNLEPTPAGVLNSLATQVNIHLEKTDYFSVSTHGVNDYTFLEYVNLRLVSVLEKDEVLGEEEGAATAVRTNRTSREDAADYLQVTFTLGSKYEPMAVGEGGLIPLDSVRVGQGTFFDSLQTQASVYHACVEYTTPAAENGVFDGATKALFDSRFTGSQTECAPAATMCKSPAATPDAFVAFNIPLGVGWLPAPDASLAENVFVELVVQADDKQAKASGGSPNNGDAPWQMKTTLFASIPVVAGGVNVFCDQVTAKTDLQDVVMATLVFGSANDVDELSRLKIVDDIGSSVLTPRDPLDFGETVSIEAGLMTLVLTQRADTTFFEQDGTSTYGIQLEDVITVHIMEQNPAFDGANTVSKKVMDLLAIAGQDNYDSMSSDAELRTRGYNLNGAFRFTIDRAANTASLEPTDALLTHCPFNPTRPTADIPFPTTCVTRRDVQGRGFPARSGSVATATEVVSAAADVAGNRAFMETVLGGSSYARDLGESFARTIAAEWELNDRYNRAFWINPGYEWTPTQTSNKAIFSISQKLFLFALVGLDENMGPARRRTLLSGSAVQQGTGVQAYTVGFRTDPATLVADLLEIPVDQVTQWEVTMQLTREQACMDFAPMRSMLRQQLERAFQASAEKVLNVQVVYVVVDMKGEDCAGLMQRRTEAGYAWEKSAEAVLDVLVAFDAPTAKYNNATLLQQPGIKTFKFEETQGFVADNTYVSNSTQYADPPEEDEGAPLGLSRTAIIIICGVVGGLVLLLLGLGVNYCHRGRCAKLREAQEAEIVTVMYLRDVKADLQDDMFGEGGQEEVDEKMHARMQNEFEDLGNARRRSDDFENAFSSPSKESRGDIF